jgi:hypothetical protein
MAIGRRYLAEADSNHSGVTRLKRMEQQAFEMVDFEKYVSKEAA